MKEFVLLFRNDVTTFEARPSPEQMQAAIKPWQDWLGSVAAQNKLVQTGPRLHPDGRVVKANNLVTNGPYAEIKEALGGFMIVRAENIDEAVTIARGCPILKSGGNVEVRGVIGNGQS